MRYMCLAVLASVGLVSCGLYDHPCDAPNCTRTWCGTDDPAVHIEYHDNKVDSTNDFVTGKLCVDSNMSPLFQVRDGKDADFNAQGRADPTKCLPLFPSSSYSASFQEIKPYRTPPDSKFEVKNGRKVIITVTYGK